MYDGKPAKRDSNGMANGKKSKVLAFCEPERIDAEGEYLHTQSIVTKARHLPSSECLLPTQQTKQTSDSLPKDLKNVPFIDDEGDESGKQVER